MKQMRIFDLKEDKKVNAKCLLVDITIDDYIELIEENLEDLDIQRGKILSRKQDVYKRLIEDLKEGTIIPPISLVLKEKSTVHEKIKDEKDLKSIEEIINKEIKKGDFSILDGLQRTYCILNVRDDIGDSEEDNFLNTRIRAEIWYGMTTMALLYKMLVLNTGQVKMSMKHQIEILNIPLRETILKIALNKGVKIEFSTYKNPILTNNNLYTYKFSDIVEAFTSFIIKGPIVDKTNVVVQELEKMKFIEEHSTVEKLLNEEEIEEFVEILINLDKALWAKYKIPIEEKTPEGETTKLPWTSRNDIMGSATVLSGIFASFGRAFADSKDKYNQRKEKLFQILGTENEKDPLKVRIMSEILQDEKKRTTKFGETTRKFFFAAFREFFKEENNFEQIWMRAQEWIKGI